MSDVELKTEREMTRHEAAERLRSIAAALDSGDRAEIAVDGATVKVRVPDRVRAELELEVDGDEVELEIELTWSISGGPGPGEPAAPPSSGAASAAPQTAEPTPGRQAAAVPEGS